MQKIAGFFLRLGKRVLGTLLLACSLYGLMNLLLGKTATAYWWMAITPPLLWNSKKILAVFHKRWWSAVAFWGGCLWWQWQVTLLFLIPFLVFKVFFHFKTLKQHMGFSARNANEKDYSNDEEFWDIHPFTGLFIVPGTNFDIEGNCYGCTDSDED